MTRTITTHPEMQMGLAGPCCADRQWFHENPEAVVRFRPLLPDELEVQTAVCRMLGAGGPPALNITGDDGHHLPLTYAVVVDLLRLTGTPMAQTARAVACGSAALSQRRRRCRMRWQWRPCGGRC